MKLLKSKFGAMFGLDARIALAIFGALSVISGAALYSAIKNAQTERYWQEFREIIKATEQYYLDNGKPLPQYAGQSVYFSDLVQNRENLSTWKGPYISGEVYGSDNVKNTMSKEFDVNSSYFSALFYQTSIWTTAVADTCVVEDVDCAVWVRFNSGVDGYAKARVLFADLDEEIDNRDGIKAGSIRMYDDTTEKKIIIYVKGIQRKKLS